MNQNAFTRAALCVGLAALAGAAQGQTSVDYVGTTSQGRSISLGLGPADAFGNNAYVLPEYSMPCEDGRRVVTGGYFPGTLTGQGTQRKFASSDPWIEVRAVVVVSDDGNTVTGTLNVVQALFTNLRRTLRETTKCDTGALSFTATRVAPPAP